MAEHADPLRIDRLVGFQVVQGATAPPGPRSDRAPFILRRFSGDGMDSVFKAIVEIRIDVPVVKRCQGHSRVDDFLHRPSMLFETAGFFLRFVVHDAALFLIFARSTHPRICDRDPFVRVNGMITRKIQGNERGNSSLGNLPRCDDQQIEMRPLFIAE